MPDIQVETGRFLQERTSETIRVVRGDDWTFTLYFRDAGSGLPIDITFWTVIFTVKINPTDPDPGIVQIIQTFHADTKNGVTTIKVPAAMTASVNAGTYYYDFQIKDGAGDISSTPYGVLEVLEQVTITT